MKRFAVTALLAPICASSLGCKDGSGATEDAGMDASLDGGAGGTAGMGGAAGIGGTGGVGGAMCEFTACPMGCVDLDTDEQNCGSCGNICEETDVCSGGICMPG